MGRYSADDIRALVKEGRIHRKVFLDPELIELEMECIFGRTWVFIAHDSQVPNVGDFFCTRIGRQPVVVVRHTDQKVYVQFNRCAHRGAMVVNEEEGNARRFQCLYHRWTYHTDGRVAGVPLHSDYPEGFDILKDANYGMLRVPRVDSYRGFVFACLAREGPGLLAYLGGARQGIDDLVGGAPDGEIEFAGGCHRYAYAGNWKHELRTSPTRIMWWPCMPPPSPPMASSFSDGAGRRAAGQPSWTTRARRRSSSGSGWRRIRMAILRLKP